MLSNAHTFETKCLLIHFDFQGDHSIYCSLWLQFLTEISSTRYIYIVAEMLFFPMDFPEKHHKCGWSMKLKLFWQTNIYFSTAAVPKPFIYQLWLVNSDKMNLGWAEWYPFVIDIWKEFFKNFAQMWLFKDLIFFKTS